MELRRISYSRFAFSLMYNFAGPAHSF